MRQWAPARSGSGCWAAPKNAAAYKGAFLTVCLCGATASARVPLLQCGVREQAGKVQGAGMSSPQPPGLLCSQPRSLSWGLGLAVSSGCPPELLGESVWQRGAACIGIYGSCDLFTVWKCSRVLGAKSRADICRSRAWRCGEALRAPCWGPAARVPF